MTRRGTQRLATAVAATAIGILIAILGGQPEALVLVTPWAVLLMLGFFHAQQGPVEASVEISEDRVLVGDDVHVTVELGGMEGLAVVASTPGPHFWPQGNSAQREEATLREALQGRQTSIRLSLQAKRWGTHDVGLAEFSVSEPYGLFRWHGEAGTPRYVRVHPTQTELRNLLSPWLVRRVTGTHRSTAVGRGVEYADIRPYTSGDSLRDINWKATARSNEVWVSQRHPDRASDAVLLLDSFVESGHDVRTVFGLAVEGALALAESHLAVNDRVGLVELGGTVRWVSPGAGSHQLQRLSDFLLATGLHPHTAERDVAFLLSRALPPRSFVVALTPLLDVRFIEALLLVAGHGHDLAVVECNPVLSESIDATDELAVRMWKAQRQIVRDRLFEHGIGVATWEPGDHLDLALSELANRRRRAIQVRSR